MDDSRDQNKRKIKNNEFGFEPSLVSYKRLKIWWKPPKALTPVSVAGKLARAWLRG